MLFFSIYTRFLNVPPAHVVHCWVIINYGNHWLNFSTQTEAFTPCLCVWSDMHIIIDIIIIYSICQHMQEPLAPACVCMVLCFFYICIIFIFHSLTQSVNTGRSLWPLPVCVWCFVSLIFVLFLYHTHISHPLTQSVNTGRSFWPEPSPPVCVYEMICILFKLWTL
jgi:hypothetical protein